MKASVCADDSLPVKQLSPLAVSTPHCVSHFAFSPDTKGTPAYCQLCRERHPHEHTTFHVHFQTENKDLSFQCPVKIFNFDVCKSGDLFSLVLMAVSLYKVELCFEKK